MDDAAFSDEFCRFLQTAVPNVTAAELLLELRGVEEGIQPRSHPDRLLLEAFVGQGIAAIRSDGRFVYRAPEYLDAHARTLALAYKERPVTLFRIIYALRDAKVQSFADAFRVRKP